MRFGLRSSRWKARRPSPRCIAADSQTGRIGRSGLIRNEVKVVGRHRGPPSLKSGGHMVVTIAVALYSTTLVTATMGFAFWVVAAVSPRWKSLVARPL